MDRDRHDNSEDRKGQIKGPLLGIDFGLKRIGLAISDPECKMTFPLKTIVKKPNSPKKDLLDEIAEIISSREINGIVFGLPLEPKHPDGQHGFMVEKVRKFARALQARTKLSIYYIDETLSTYEALERLNDSKVKSTRIAEIIDQKAAEIILETYLQRERNV